MVLASFYEGVQLQMNLELWALKRTARERITMVWTNYNSNYIQNAEKCPVMWSERPTDWDGKPKYWY
jgi:hypothetical protein